MAEWRPVPGYESRYLVSSEGQVQSVRRGRLLKVRPPCRTRPYPYVALFSGPTVDTRRNLKLHTLVARAFLGPRPPGLVIRHLDGDATNCRADNLRYGTYGENSLDTVAHGRHPDARKTHCVHGHPFDEVNTYRWGGKRSCRACRQVRKKQRRSARLSA